jgi:hypothetical protein
MFKILPSTYFWPITAHVAEEGQIVEKILFQAEFKRPGHEKLLEIEKLPALEQVQAVVVGWRDCKDMNGDNVDFSPLALSDLIDEFPEIVPLFFEAYRESIPLVKRKN